MIGSILWAGLGVACALASADIITLNQPKFWWVSGVCFFLALYSFRLGRPADRCG